MAELIADDELQRRSATARLPTVRMSRPEKGVLLSLFIEHKLHEMTREQRESASDEITEKFLSNSRIRPRTKHKFEPRHVLNYYRDFNRPIVDNEGAAMPFVREDGKVVMGDDHNPKLDTELIDRQENSAPGSKEYWNNLISFDEMCKIVTTTTDNTPEEHMSRMQEMRERRKDLAKRQRERYTAQREAHKRRKNAKEKQGMESDLFKNQVLHASLVTAQQNATNFHAFTTAFCAMAHRPAPAPINLPHVPALPEACIEPLPDEPSGSVVTGELKRGNNNVEGHEKVVEEEDAESEIGN